MPLTASIVDELRREFGAAAIDRCMRDTAGGRPRFYAAELGADGQVREWGRPPGGVRARVVDGAVCMPGWGAPCS